MPRPIINLPRHGGARKGAGRKPLPGEGGTVTWNMRLTAMQRAVVESLGGAAWVRAQIDRHSQGPDHERQGHEPLQPPALT